MVTKGLNKITQNETQDLQLVDNFCKSWGFTPIFLAKSTGLIFYETIVFNNILAIMLNFEEDYGGKKEI